MALVVRYHRALAIPDQAALQTAVVAMMRAYGMTPVLPGFAGHVPAAAATDAALFAAMTD